MKRRTTASSMAAIALAAMMTAGCGGTGSTPTASPTPTPTPIHTSAVPSPTPTPVPAPTPTGSTGTLPTACDQLGSAATRQQTIGDLTQQPGEGFTRPAPAGAELALGCNWIQDEAAAVLILISTATDAAVTTAVAELAPQGYTCQASDDFGAQFCTKSGNGPDTEDVVVARDGVWIYLETVNVNARGWLSEIAQQIFG